MTEYKVILPLGISFNLNEEDKELFLNVLAGVDYYTCSIDEYEYKMSKAQLDNVIQHLQFIKEKMI
jgi:hypothetical protein